MYALYLGCEFDSCLQPFAAHQPLSFLYFSCPIKWRHKSLQKILKEKIRISLEVLRIILEDLETSKIGTTKFTAFWWLLKNENKISTLQQHFYVKYFLSKERCKIIYSSGVMLHKLIFNSFLSFIFSPLPLKENWCGRFYKNPRPFPLKNNSCHLVPLRCRL